MRPTTEQKKRATDFLATAPTPTEHQGHVYFVLDCARNAVKIGYTRGTPRQRLRTLQIGHPDELRLLASVPGCYAAESALHQRFAGLRLRSEWFRHEGPLAEYIAQQQAIAARMRALALRIQSNGVDIDAVLDLAELALRRA